MKPWLSVAASIAFWSAAAAAAPPIQQSAAEAVAQDAEDYARRHGVSLPDAIRRLRAQEESVAATEQLRASFGERLAGISIQHRPISGSSCC
jgi:hypothetical protein